MKQLMLLLLGGLFLGLSQTATAQTAPAESAKLVCFFTGENYQGAHFCFRPGQQPPSLDAFPLSDGTYTNGVFGSIKVEGGAVADAYDSPNFESINAQPLHIEQSLPSLSAVWNDTILSVSVY